MKAIKILTFVIIGILIVGAGVGAYVYFCTDTFKSTKEIFYNYLGENQAEQLLESDRTEQLLTKLSTQNSEQKINVNLNAVMNGQNVLNNSNILINGKTNIAEKKSELNVIFGDNDKKDILEIDTAKDQEKYGLSFKGITNRYITLENKNLDIFWAKLGIANLNLDKIEPTEYSTQLSSKQDNVKKLLSNSFGIIKEKASKEKYSNLGKMETELDGENVQVSAYELKLSSDEMKQVFSSLKSSNIDVNKIIDTSSFLGDSIENLGFDFTETIYVHGGNLARIQITMKDSYSQTIQIVKTFEKNDITLSLQVENSKGTQIMADITKNSTENNEKYVMNLELTATEELRIVADINVDIAFNTNATITALTDENSYIINEKSGDDIKDLFQKIFEMIKYVNEQNSMRISTGMLNDVLSYATTRVQPPSDKGKRLKIYYMTQASTKPPTFVTFVNRSDLFHFSYQRYLENQIRATFGLTGTPVRFVVRERGDK